MILADYEIAGLAKRGMITPFDERRLNPFGYDITLADEFALPLDNIHELLDPFNDNSHLFAMFKILNESNPSNYIVIPPNSFILGKSIEKLTIPRDTVGICLGRSSYARCGVISNVTPLEAGWEGVVTIEIANLGPWPVKVYANKGITQVQFHRGNMPIKDYVAKGGRYQGQKGITFSRGV